MAEMKPIECRVCRKMFIPPNRFIESCDDCRAEEKRPFAIAPYMGENAFIAYMVVREMGWQWQTALGAVFVAGARFVALTIGRVRQWMLEAIPAALRRSFSAGIGLFLAFIGLNECGIVALGVAGALVRMGASASPAGWGRLRLRGYRGPANPPDSRRDSDRHRRRLDRGLRRRGRRWPRGPECRRIRLRSFRNLTFAARFSGRLSACC